MATSPTGTASSQTGTYLKRDNANAGADPRSGTNGKAAKDDQSRSGNLKLGTRLVNVTVTVTDAVGKSVDGLSKEQFEVFDNDVRQEIAHFSDEDSPVSLGIVYDVSASMKSLIEESLAALKRFVETSHPDDEFFLVSFNNRVIIAEDFTTGDRLIERLAPVGPRGTTALFDATTVAIEKLKHGRYPKKALLIISDGEDNTSRTTYNQLRERVRESDVVIYAIGLAGAKSGIFPSYGGLVLDEITRLGGGRAFFLGSKEDELLEICARIALDLRHQYSLGFYPTDTSARTEWRSIKVRASPPKSTGKFKLSYKKKYASFER
ncbi:MAG TPA: VWA domain-containing protein [Blastocatellia bacterium]|nr:VWA domain-containing protein [Blastocatellia bacterium]